MGNRYKRMVTLGMISFTALLAWGYCMLAYRSQVMYIAIISLVLVGSIYALLLSVVDVKMAKEQEMQDFVTKTLQESMKQDNSEITACLDDLERLLKASYVQQRKTATYLSVQDTQLDEAVRKTAKLLINYDRKKEQEKSLQAEQKQTELEMQAALEAQKELDHTALVLEEFGKLAGDVRAVVAQLAEVTEQLQSLRDAVDAIEIPKFVETPMMGMPAEVDAMAAQEAAVSQDVQARGDVQEAVTTTVPSGEQENVTESADGKRMEVSADAIENTETVEVPAGMTENAEVVEAPGVPENIEAGEAPADEQEETFNTEDFFSQFGGSADQELKEEAAFKEEASNSGMMDQSMIDALLGNLASGSKSPDPAKPADVIPFPQKEQAGASTEEAHVEEAAEAVHEEEQERMDAAGMQAEPEHTDTPDVTPIDDNPNRTLSPEEIAALFASMQ